MARAQKTHAQSIFFSEIQSNMSSVRSMNELLQLENAAEAFDLLMSGKARFRAGSCNRTLSLILLTSQRQCKKARHS
jgi:hypothetical protein